MSAIHVLPLLLGLSALPVHAQHEHHQQPQPPRPAPVAKPAPAPGLPLPEPTAEERAAAFPDLDGMDMRGHMVEDPLIATLLVDQFEWQEASDASGMAWNLRGWLGTSNDRWWLRSEGERRRDATEHADVELLWGHPTGPWWDVVAGIRHDFGPDARDWVAIGVQGLAPYRFELEATAYFGPSGRTAIRADTEYDVLLTNRWILQPRLEVNLHGRDDRERGIGAGFTDAEFGLRLRYEVRREFAPYLGYAWSRKFGRTADFAESDGEAITERMWVAGIRFWL